MKSIKFLTNEKLIALISNYNLKNLKVVDYDKNNAIIIFIQMKSIIRLEENWKALSSLLSEYIEEFLNNYFKRWNIYILYLVDDAIDKGLKYRIENNTFFARKIVEDKYILELIDENIDELITKHITFTDLEFHSTSLVFDDYISDSKVYKELIGVENLDKNVIIEILNKLEKDEDSEN